MDDDKIRLSALQGVLQAAGSYRMRVDGVVGAGTVRAIKTQPEVARKAADVIGGDVLSDLISSVTEGGKRAIEAIKSAANEFRTDALKFVAKAKIESDLDPRATRGSFKGLFQMGPSAWEDAQAVVSEQGLPPLGDYSSNWMDPLQNSRAAMAYQMALDDQVKRLGYQAPLSETDRYLAHQQGAYGLVRIRRAASGQKLSATDADAMLKAMRSNPPQDGQGVTVDPNEFLTRWDDVFAKRYADAVA